MEIGRNRDGERGEIAMGRYRDRERGGEGRWAVNIKEEIDR